MKYIEKETKNNGTLIIKEIDRNVAKSWIMKFHYSKKFNTSFGKITFGIFKDDKLLGVAVYGNMMNPASHHRICDTGKDSIIELNRLHLSDDLVKNAETVFISSTFKLIKSNYPEIKYIQSFADGRLGCGTIYKASNFKYYGYHLSGFFKHKETGEYIHEVNISNTARMKMFMLLNKLWIDDMLNYCQVKSYRYIYELYPKKFNVKLYAEVYPPYEKGIIDVEYKPPLSLMCRFYILANTTYKNKIKKRLSEYDDVLVEETIKLQEKNKYVSCIIGKLVI